MDIDGGGRAEDEIPFHEGVRVDTGQCLLKQGVAGSFLKAKTTQQVGVEVHKGDEVTIAESRVELESEEDKENGEWELDRSAVSGPDVGDGIAKADKFVEQKVITASLGRIM